MADIFDQLIDFVLGNIGIVVFAIFLLSGLIGRGDKNKKQSTTQTTSDRKATAQDERPLAERMAEYFGLEIDEEHRPTQAPAPQQKKPLYASEGRRSTTMRNVQENYPELYGGSGLFGSSSDAEEKTQWGFDESEWGSTFEKSEEQWGNTFPDRKSSEPVIDWPR